MTADEAHPKILSLFLKHLDGASSNQEEVKAGTFVNTCGAWAGYINDLVYQSCPQIVDFTTLPVTPKKRNVIVVKVMEEDAEKFDDVPLIFDHTGLWIRRDGRRKSPTFLIGKSPSKENDPDYFWSPNGNCLAQGNFQQAALELFCDCDYFETEIWEPLAARIPIFERCKAVGGWAGFYDYNSLDQNGIVGKHPEVSNMYVATGFSGHGLQQSPAVGRAIAELVLFNEFKTIDLKKFSLHRIKENKPIAEKNIY